MNMFNGCFDRVFHNCMRVAFKHKTSVAVLRRMLSVGRPVHTTWLSFCRPCSRLVKGEQLRKCELITSSLWRIDYASA